MDIKVFLFLCGLLFNICTTNLEPSYAIADNKHKSFEEGFIEYGYKNVKDAVKDFETYIEKDIKLPLQLPPITFTHCFGRFNDGEGNRSLEVRCLNEHLGKNHYKIYVRPIEDRIRIKDKRIENVYKLMDGSEAKLINISELFEALVFEKDHLQYWLSIDKRCSDKVTSEVLVEIANSIDYPSEKKNTLQ